MLSKGHFYWGMFRKYALAFAHVVKDIHVIRTNDLGVAVKDITVPVTYAQKSKLFYYLQRRAGVERRVRTVLPRISFVVTSMQYDSSRKLNALNTCSFQSEGAKQSFRYSGVPWNFTVEMSMWASYMDDLLQIIEQVATFFKPDYSVDVVEIPELGLVKSVPITLDAVNLDIGSEYEDEDRVVRADATFTLRGWLYPPMSESSIIKHIYAGAGLIDTRKILQTVQLDWDEVNGEIETVIKEGLAYYDFASAASISTSAVTQLSKQFWLGSSVDISTGGASTIQV